MNLYYQDSLISQPKIVFSLGKILISDTLISSFVVTLAIAIFFFIITYKLDLNSKRGFISETIYQLSEMIVNSTIGEKGIGHIPFIAMIFFYLLIANVIGFFPIPFIYIEENTIISTLTTPTSDLNTTAALSLFAYFYITITAISSKGLKKYLKSFLEPLPFLLPLNIIGEVAKPFSLAMRLFGNIFSGSLILALGYRYLPWIFPSFLHLYFDIFAGILQSLIFVFLTSVYFSFAID